MPELGGPRGGLRTGEVEHPVGEVGHEATAGGDRDEVVGCDLAPVVVPPGEGLERDGLAAGEVDDRLVVRLDAAAGERLAQRFA